MFNKVEDKTTRRMLKFSLSMLIPETVIIGLMLYKGYFLDVIMISVFILFRLLIALTNYKNQMKREERWRYLDSILAEIKNDKEADNLLSNDEKLDNLLKRNWRE